MSYRRFEVWLANLNPQRGTEVGKTRPVVVVQSDLLNAAGHPSTMICPLTTNVQPDATILRVHLNDGDAGLNGAGDILVDQVTAIDNKRFRRKLGDLPDVAAAQLADALRIVLDLEE